MTAASPGRDTAQETARKVTRRANRTITVIQSCMGVMVGAAIILIALLFAKTGQQGGLIQRQGSLITRQERLIRQEAAVIRQNEKRVQTSCAFWADLGNLPVAAQSTKLGVGIVAHSRDAFAGYACPGHLIRPAPELLHLAKKFGVPVRH